ncbi:MAG: LruC domain-containing protein [Owenweeksia sp.]|nr:LruC domain-containing protein [Owenweeksia sp.]
MPYRNITGSINVNRGNVTLRICGTANMQNINLNSGSGLVVTDGASLSVNNMSLNSANGTLTIYDATVNVNGNFNPSGAVINHGSLNISNSLNINGQASLVNNGDLDVTHNLINNSQFTNNSQVAVGNRFILNGNSSTTNNCSINVDGNTTFNSSFNNYGLLSCEGTLTVNGGGASTLYDGAMITAAEAMLNSSLTGSGITSLVRISGKTTINGGGSINGNLEYCDADGIETNWGTINAPAALACNVYIPTSTCNAEGNGTPQVIDSDNDGVADKADLFPNDPTACGATSYPANASYATLAFEDLWPSRGDYDFNDLVLDYRHDMITNANNDVVRIESEYVVVALGGSFKKGFGFQLNVAPSEINSVTGQFFTTNGLSIAANGTEQGQSKATIMVFDNAFKVIRNMGGTAFVNTDPSEAGKDSDTLRTVVDFNSPQPAASLGAAPFNPFIYINGDRGKELHLIDQGPTDLANTSFFGNGVDASDPASGDYYKTQENHPWALNIIGGFEYPVEKTDIVEAHNFFDIWAQSGGSMHTDWFMDFPGYRASGKVY